MKLLFEKPDNYDVSDDINHKLDEIETYVQELQDQLGLIQQDIDGKPFRLFQNYAKVSPLNFELYKTLDQLNIFLKREARYKDLQNPENIGGYFFIPANASKKDLETLLEALPPSFALESPALSNIIESIVTKKELPPEKSQLMEITIPLLKTETWLIETLLKPENTFFQDVEKYLKNFEPLILEVEKMDRSKLSKNEDMLLQELKSFFQGGSLNLFKSSTNNTITKAEFDQTFKRGLKEILSNHHIETIDDIDTLSRGNVSRPIEIFQTIKKVLNRIFDYFFPEYRTQKFKNLKETFANLQNEKHNETDEKENINPNSNFLKK